MSKVLAALFAVALTLAGCNKPQSQSGAAGAGETHVSGAGATFPAPLYAKWAQAYAAKTGVRVNYQAIGSGGGIKQIKAKTVAFGATDKPLKPEDLDQAGLYQFPTVMGGVTPIVNVPGLQPGQLRLTGALLADIYLGKVKKWNEPAVSRLNPGVALPNLLVTVVHRAEGSGTSFLFTSYLSLKNPEWSRMVGANDAVQWPTGLGGKGNDGVAAFVKQTSGAIGYVEYAYAKTNNMAYVQLQNHDGLFVMPNAGTFAASAAGADWSKAPGNYLLLLDQPGAQSWPITGATFILAPKRFPDATVGRAVIQFFDWAYANGDAAADALDYVPLPASVKERVRRQWADLTGPDGKPIYGPSSAP
jgi:phosphate transport system substrate-binding protein